MSLDKAVKHGKEKRRPFRGSKRWDVTYRNHGACGYCRSSRTHAARRVLAGGEAS